MNIEKWKKEGLLVKDFPHIHTEKDSDIHCLNVDVLFSSGYVISPNPLVDNFLGIW